jgi:chloramphenicol 3-O phosphotransferase
LHSGGPIAVAAETTRPALGRIVLLNGAPRAGKSSIARALQAKGDWLIFGVDAMMAMTPAHRLPGIGLRPGGERPDLEDFVRRSYAALFAGLAAFARQGIAVVSDVGLHDSYSRPLGITQMACEMLADLPLLWVGVHCPIDVIMARRNADTSGTYAGGSGVPLPVQRWQDEVHAGKQYDLEVDTSMLTPGQCAEKIASSLARK